MHEAGTLPLEAVVELRTLSEHESKQLLATRGALFAGEAIVPDAQQAAAAAQRFGFPVVVKLVGERLAHKSERGLVRVGLGDANAVQQAAQDLLALRRADDGEVGLLVAQHVSGSRELLVGMVRDPLFGVVIVVGVGGVNAEAFGDVQMRIAPVSYTHLTLPTILLV